MTPYKNVHTDTLSIGRIKIKPMEERVFDFLLTEKEAKTVQYFVEKGYLVAQEPKKISITEQTEEVIEPVTKKRGKRSNANSE